MRGEIRAEYEREETDWISFSKGEYRIEDVHSPTAIYSASGDDAVAVIAFYPVLIHRSGGDMSGSRSTGMCRESGGGWYGMRRIVKHGVAVEDACCIDGDDREVVHCGSSDTRPRGVGDSEMVVGCAR